MKFRHCCKLTDFVICFHDCHQRFTLDACILLLCVKFELRRRIENVSNNDSCILISVSRLYALNKIGQIFLTKILINKLHLLSLNRFRSVQMTTILLTLDSDESSEYIFRPGQLLKGTLN